jgi:hypothetical protein
MAEHAICAIKQFKIVWPVPPLSFAQLAKEILIYLVDPAHKFKVWQ